MSETRKRKNPKVGAPKRKNIRLKSPAHNEDSSDSVGSDASLNHNVPSPIAEESIDKLPEQLLKSFYKPPGKLMIAGMVSWEHVAKRENNPLSQPNLYTFHRFTDRKYRLIVSSCSAAHSLLISDEGEAYSFGRNNFGQLGFGDTNTRDVPEAIPGLAGKNIIHAATGRNHSLFVTDTGTVYACGDNKCGQCGVGNSTKQILVPTRIRYAGAPIVKVGCGADFSMILDCKGTLHSFGLPEYGQLGHNTDGKFFVTSTKLSFHFETVPKQIVLFIEKSKERNVTPVEDVEIVDFSCGNNHTVAIDSKKRAFSWGFGGFGRLGHAGPHDEGVPRLIKFFDMTGRGVRSVFCGATYSLAVNELGSLFLFGQTKRTGEANMYPKPIQDLAGCAIKAVGASNTSIVVACEDMLVAWGTSPTYGELGNGTIKKSSPKPMEVTKMDGISITQVAMGFSHTLLLVDDSADDVKEKFNAMPAFEPK